MSINDVDILSEEAKEARDQSIILIKNSIDYVIYYIEHCTPTIVQERRLKALEKILTHHKFLVSQMFKLENELTEYRKNDS